ncbi:hypothetical protein KCU81_g7292, partial [Aureobasidium melanogenum]|uniref:Uncharacterized protein n=1 Tax=Aureobasidium melanogenum (strain CBS 110374) TaxID=1043003 RepID=A0A074VQQ4_AURM1
MPLADKEAEFEDLWEQMEELTESGDKADKKLARAIAKHLVSYAGLPRSYGIRAHMALASLVYARDVLRDAEQNNAKIHVMIPSKLQAELQIIREAYKSKETEAMIVIDEDEAAEDTSESPRTTTAQLGLGTQEEPIDLTLEYDSTPFENTCGRSLGDPACDQVETKARSGLSLWPRSKYSYARPEYISSK